MIELDREAMLAIVLLVVGFPLGLNCAWYADILLTLTAAPSIGALSEGGSAPM